MRLPKGSYLNVVVPPLSLGTMAWTSRFSKSQVDARPCASVSVFPAKRALFPIVVDYHTHLQLCQSVYPSNAPSESNLNFAEIEQDPNGSSMLSRDVASISEATLSLAEAKSGIGGVST